MGLAPWCANERWEFWLPDGTPSSNPEGCKWARVTGRQPCPPDLKKNFGWWWRNDYEQQLSEAPWFEPGKDEATRARDWALRNPFQNANLFVLGCADKNYTVIVDEGHMNPFAIQRNDFTGPDGKPETGYQKARLYAFEDKSKDRAWTSYSGKLVYYYGTQPTGLFALKFNIHSS